MEIRFADSATRHDISQEQATHVVENCPSPLYSNEPDEEDLVTLLWFDQYGTPLEVIAVEGEGYLLVIHAMKMRDKYTGAFEAMLEEHS